MTECHLSCRLLEVLDQQSIKKGIFIYDGKLTPAAQKVRSIGKKGCSYMLTIRRIQAITSVRTELGIDVEAFQEAELLVNITQHDLVPQHSVLSLQEKKELLAK